MINSLSNNYIHGEVAPYMKPNVKTVPFPLPVTYQYDTFMASLIADYPAIHPSAISAEDLFALGANAVQAAAITVTRPGADLPWLTELAAEPG